MNIQMHVQPKPSKCLLDLPELCLICILSHLPLNQLLLVACVCTRFDALKRLICSRQTKLTLAPYPELMHSSPSRKCDLSSNMISFFDLKFNPHQTLFTPYQRRFLLRTKYSKFIVYTKLKNISRIFPNITSLVVFRLELTIQKSYIESYIEELSNLLFYTNNLTNLTLVINEKFHNSKLVDVILCQRNLESLKINLGISNHNKTYVKTLISSLSTNNNKLTRLSIGKFKNFTRINQLITQSLNSNSKIESLGLMLRPSERDELQLFDPENLDRKHVLSRLHFEVKSIKSLGDLRLISEHFANITYLQVLIEFNMKAIPGFIYFTEIANALCSLKKLHTLKVTTSGGLFLNELIFPSCLRKLPPNLPRLPSVKSLEINSAKFESQIQISLPHDCTCNRLTHLYRGSIICCIGHIFPNLRTLSISPNFVMRMRLEIDFMLCILEIVLIIELVCFVLIILLLVCICLCLYFSYHYLNYLFTKYVRRLDFVTFAHYLRAVHVFPQ